MEEVDKGYSEFYVTVGTATRTGSILIHSRLKVLAVNLSRSASQLWLYAGLIWSNNPHCNRNAPTLVAFRQELKTVLFRECFPVN